MPTATKLLPVEDKELYDVFHRTLVNVLPNMKFEELESPPVPLVSMFRFPTTAMDKSWATPCTTTLLPVAAKETP